MRAQQFGRWLPAVVWAALILLSSGDAASADATGSFLQTIFKGLTRDQIFILNFVIRKGAHLAAYGILGALNLRALRGEKPLLALALSVLVAIIDESRQAISPARNGSPWDVRLDTAAAAGAQLWWRVRYPVRR